MLKIIDRFLIKSFLPPLVASFFIALFVLVMQFLWQNIAHLVGKGLSMWTILEVISYMSIKLVPLALPIAVLLSSVLVFGGAAERFEMASMKSAGVSFLRMSWSVMLFCILLGFLSFFTSNNVIPVTNLKLHTRMHDIKKTKPTLNLEEGIFNTDFRNYVIRIGEKGLDGESLKDVLIYDQTRQSTGLYNSMMADSGRMYVSDDERYFIMELYNGQRYEEVKPDYKRGSKYAFTKADFAKWSKIFDLSEFDMNETDEQLLASHRYMLTVGQINEDTDSLRARSARVVEDITPYFGHSDGLADVREQSQIIRKEASKVKASLVSNQSSDDDNIDRYHRLPKTNGTIIAQDLDSLQESFLATFPAEDKIRLLTQAKGFSENYYNRLRASAQKQQRNTKSIAKNHFEVHTKFANAVMCMIFLLIGGPMGAIVRKGGYGVSLLVAIIFFVVFIVSNIFFRKLAHKLVLDPVVAAWAAPVVLLVIGLWLTIKASSDSNVLSRPRWMDRLLSRIRPIQG